MCSTLILLNVRLNGISHLLVHNNELQTAQKEKTTKLRIHLLTTIKKKIKTYQKYIYIYIYIKNSPVKKYYCYKNNFARKVLSRQTVCYKNYHEYETKLRKWEAYYSIYWKLMLDFCRTIFENPFGFNATPLCLYTKTNNLEIQ